MKTNRSLILTTALLTGSLTNAEIYIPTSLVGDAGNPNDSSGFGQVNYAYHIGTYEVTNSQYAAFLNATAATDTHGLYNTDMASHGGISRSGNSGSYAYNTINGRGNHAVNFVSFWDAARFTNWLTTGNTEAGVYVLTPEGIANNTIARDATAWANGGVAIANRNEWHKAAYYAGSPTGADGDGYWLYPTQSNSITSADANYDFTSGGGSVTDVGSYSGAGSYYGTFDQAGNVWERLEDLSFNGLERTMGGGSYQNSDIALQADFGWNSDIDLESPAIGFRVVSLGAIPEPSAFAAVLGSLALAVAIARRRR